MAGGGAAGLDAEFGEDLKKVLFHRGLADAQDGRDVTVRLALRDPEQYLGDAGSEAKVVRRTFNGPSRIRGPAGTGKTVVGLHRAAHLARTKPGRVLVTTFIRTLPDVLGALLTRLAPETVDRVDFCGIHAFARRTLLERGVDLRLEPSQSAEAFALAWERVGAGSSLGRLDQRYWSDEIRCVLKGRGITTWEAYADLSRTGRRHRLDLNGRRAVWDLYEAYDGELRRRRVHDYADVILLAEAELRREPMRGVYSSVLVDEAQDLSCAMVRMLHSLVGDDPDGLTLIGDGQQSIYPGGYSLAEAGVSVATRGVVFDVNYRNTGQIVSFAQRLVDGDEYPDIEGVVARGDVPSSVPRSGPEPVIARFDRRPELNAKMIERITSVTKGIDTGPGDVAKGLEFKQVLIPDIRRDQTALEPPPSDTEHERWDLTRRELYVGMTRARDGLWVGVGS